MAGAYGTPGQTFVKAFGAGASIAQQEAKAKADQKAQMVQAVEDAIRQSEDVASQYADAVRSGEQGYDTPGFRDAFEQHKAQALKTYDMASGQGYRTKSSREAIISRFDTILARPTAAQERELAAKKAGAITGAEEVAKAGVAPPKVANYRMPGGELIGVDENSEEGRAQVADILKQGGVRLTSYGVQGATSEALAPKEEIGLRDAEINTRNLLTETDRVREQLASGAEISLAGSVLRGLNSITHNLAATTNAVTGGDDVHLLDPNQYKDVWAAFGPEAAKSAALRTNIINLAYLKIRSSHGAGTLSNQDMAQAMRMMGGNWASPTQLKASLEEIERQALSGFQTRFTVLKGGEGGETFPVDLQERLDAFSPEAAGEVVGSQLYNQLLRKPAANITEAEFMKLSPEARDQLMTDKAEELQALREQATASGGSR